MFRGKFREMYRPVLFRALCKYRHEGLIDTGAAISLLPVRNVPIGVTVQHSDIVIEGISSESQCAVGKVDLKFQLEFSGKVFNISFHILQWFSNCAQPSATTKREGFSGGTRAAFLSYSKSFVNSFLCYNSLLCYANVANSFICSINVKYI